MIFFLFYLFYILLYAYAFVFFLLLLHSILKHIPMDMNTTENTESRSKRVRFAESNEVRSFSTIDNQVTPTFEEALKIINEEDDKKLKSNEKNLNMQLKRIFESMTSSIKQAKNEDTLTDCIADFRSNLTSLEIQIDVLEKNVKTEIVRNGGQQIPNKLKHE
jgi:hypothetical protein